jgi:hypothetical protein
MPIPRMLMLVPAPADDGTLVAPTGNDVGDRRQRGVGHILDLDGGNRQRHLAGDALDGRTGDLDLLHRLGRGRRLLGRSLAGQAHDRERNRRQGEPARESVMTMLHAGVSSKG